MNEFFYLVKDPRRDRGKIRHSLENVPRLALFAAICFSETYDGMEGFAEDRLDELKAKGLVSQDCGVPYADTFMRLLNSVDPHQFNLCLRKYTKDIIDTLAEKADSHRRQEAPRHVTLG
ncbi:MAG: transposase family protein [Clostridium sp.]|nr:transposase family protein [Clostridium sp.]